MKIKKRDDKMSRDIIEIKSQFEEYMKENKGVLWVVLLSVVLSYGISLSGLRIGIDAEVNLNSPDEFLNSWYSIGRFTLVFLKNLTGLRPLNPMLADILMLIMMVCYGLFADFLFFIFSGNDKRMKAFYLIFPALFLTHPVFVQQYIFSVQSFEVAFCMFLCLVCVYCISRWAFLGGRKFFLTGIILMVLSFGAYQAFVPFYMAAALAVFLVYYYFHDGQKKGFYLKSALCHALSFVCGFVLYQLMVKAVLLWHQGPGFRGEYLQEQILWMENSVSVCIGTIKNYMGRILLGKSEFYPKTFFIFALFFAAHLLFQWYKKRRKEYVLYAAAAMALVLSPFYLAFYQGSGTLMRSQFALPFAAAFFGAAAVAFTVGNKRKFLVPLTALCLLLSFNQGTTASRALYSAYMTYEHDKMVAQLLVARLQELNAAQPGQKVVMIGQYHPELPESASVREETIGYSYFEWDFMEKSGVTKRGCGFLRSLGFPFEAASPEEFEAAKAYSYQMPDWPCAGSVQMIGDVAVIRFSGE